MKNTLIYYLLILITLLPCVGIIALGTIIWLILADGKTILEITTDFELILRFVAASISFGVLVLLYIKFIVFLLSKTDDND